MPLIESNKLHGMLCFDIETAPKYKSFSELSIAEPRMAAMWLKKHKKIDSDGKPADTYLSNASFYPEFAQIVCISFGRLVQIKDSQNYKLQLRSYYQDEERNERAMLDEVVAFIDALDKKSNFTFCGHNIKRFDITFLVKRLFILGKPIHQKLRTWTLKPWEIDMVDTMELWNLGVFGAENVSLDMLTALFDIPSPKGAMDGSQVHEKFLAGQYKEIAEYCEEDVIATAKVAMNFAYKSHNLLEAIEK